MAFHKEANWHNLILKNNPQRAWQETTNMRRVGEMAELEEGFSKCQCVVCKRNWGVSGSTIVSPDINGFQINLLHTNCLTNNIIYLIGCQKCQQWYIGQTTRHFKDTFKEHQLIPSDQRKKLEDQDSAVQTLSCFTTWRQGLLDSTHQSIKRKSRC